MPRVPYTSFIPHNDIPSHMNDYTPAGGKSRTVDHLATFLNTVLMRDMVGYKN